MGWHAGPPGEAPGRSAGREGRGLGRAFSVVSVRKAGQAPRAEAWLVWATSAGTVPGPWDLALAWLGQRESGPIRVQKPDHSCGLVRM